MPSSSAGVGVNAVFILTSAEESDLTAVSPVCDSLPPEVDLYVTFDQKGLW
jgi:hypothetical protein